MLFSRAEYIPDKNHSKEDNVTVEPHIKGVTVYTRWPWTAFYRGRKAMQIAESSYVDLKAFSELAKNTYKAGMYFLEMKKERANEFAENNKHLKDMFEDFQQLLLEDIDSLKAVFKNKQPENYGNYDVGGADGADS